MLADHPAAAGRRLGDLRGRATASWRTCGSTSPAAHAVGPARAHPQRAARLRRAAQRDARARAASGSTFRLGAARGRRGARASASWRTRRARRRGRRGGAVGRAARGRRRARVARRSGRRARRTLRRRACAGCARRGCCRGPCSRKGSGPRPANPCRIYNRSSRAATARGDRHEPDAENQASRRGRGRPRNKALLAVIVVVIVVALGGLAVLGWVVSVASSAPPLSSLKTRDPGSNSVVYSADGQRLGFIPADELRRPGAGYSASRRRAQRDGRDRGRALLPPQGRRLRGRRARGASRTSPRSGPCRAARPSACRSSATSTSRTRRAQPGGVPAQDPRGQARRGARERALQALDPRHVPQHGALRHRRRPDRHRRKAAARMYFSKPRREAHAARGRAAGRPAAGADRLLAVPLARRRQARRNEVLRKMAQLGMIIDAAGRGATMRRSLGVESLDLLHPPPREVLLRLRQGRAAQGVRRPDGAQGGLRVYTTIDLKKQQEARTAISNKLAGVGPSSAIVTIDPRNGYIKAMASSADYGQSKFNLAAQGHRQPGSTFKVMALMAALREGVDPDRTHYVSRSPTVISDTPWGPIKSRPTAAGAPAASASRRATLKSDNSVYIQLALDLGPEKVKKTARTTSASARSSGPTRPRRSAASSDGVSPLEMANAYATIASGGCATGRPPSARSRSRAAGWTRASRCPSASASSASAPSRTGRPPRRPKSSSRTSRAAPGRTPSSNCPAAGKTGTTDNNTDAWFVGFTPRLATAVWVGYPKQQAYMNTEYHGGPVDGGTFPAEIWGEYMSAAKGGFCGDFKAPRQAFAAKPFDGGSGYGRAQRQRQQRIARPRHRDRPGARARPAAGRAGRRGRRPGRRRRRGRRPPRRRWWRRPRRRR